MGISHLHLSLEQVWLMPFGFLLDLVECWKQETGRATPYRLLTIDDVIPEGI
ncbi:hypothetical protein [Rothia sp. 32237D007AR]